MRVEQSFTVRRPPDEVFAYMTDPANLTSWQTSKVAVEPLTEGPPRKGYRVRERTKMGLRQWDQVVEFTEFEPGHAFATHVVDAPMPVDGRWTFHDDQAGGTIVRFVAEGPLSGAARLVEPFVSRGVARSFRRYHKRLAREVEARGGAAHGAA